jgi:RNA polymerase sigma-70 factor (ECF subfamily)
MNKNRGHRQFEKEIGPLQPFIRRVARRYLDDVRLVQEVSQDVLVSAWKNFDILPQSEDSLRGWLYTATKRAALTYGRWLKKECEYEYAGEIDSDGGILQYGEGKIFPLMVCESSSFVDPFIVADVNSFLGDLSSNHRDVLLLWMSGFDYAQMAQVTSASPGTVRSRLHYARKKARRALACHC